MPGALLDPAVLWQPFSLLRASPRGPGQLYVARQAQPKVANNVGLIISFGSSALRSLERRHRGNCGRGMAGSSERDGGTGRRLRVKRNGSETTPETR
jgi:hypothetical protein